MKCKKIAVLIAAILLVAFHAVGQNPEQLAAQAAKAYNNKQYPEAITLYDKIIADGYESYALYYNLGNAYFRNNQNAPAVLYYEKALKLSPNNEDIKHNIEVVNSKLSDKVEQVPELFYKRWWKQLLNIMDIDAMAITNIILLTLALLLFSIYIAVSGILIRKLSFWTGIAFFLLFSIGIIAASQRNYYLTNNHEAVIFEPTVNIKSSPDENSKDIFVLHEGTKVTLLDVVSNWQEIRIANGSTGWIKTSDIRNI
ncbi:MAG: SH3 domain-containing protein [Lentimicrobiaceae bacterium]|jgi:tetratricopeptide (TPR) repeat protein